MKPVILHCQANVELTTAAKNYQCQRPELATDFLERGPGRLTARLENETAIEWHGRVAHLTPDLQSSHGVLIDRFVVAKFSAMEVTEADRTQAIGALVDLYNSATASTASSVSS